MSNPTGRRRRTGPIGIATASVLSIADYTFALWVTEPTEDEGLDEGRAREGADAANEAGIACGVIGDRGHQGLQGSSEIGDTDHWTLLWVI